MPAAPVDSIICDKAVTDKVLSAVRATSDDDILSRPTVDNAIFVPAYIHIAERELNVSVVPLTIETRAPYTLSTGALRVMIDPVSNTDEPWIDMVLAPEKLKMLPEYNPRYEDDMSENDVEEESVSAGLSTTTIAEVTDRVYADDSVVMLKL